MLFLKDSSPEKYSRKPPFKMATGNNTKPYRKYLNPFHNNSIFDSIYIIKK